MAPRRNNLSNHHTTSSSSTSSATLNTPQPLPQSSSSSSVSSTTTTTGSVVDVHNLLGLTVISGGGGVGGGIAVSVDQDNNHHLTIETSKIFASPVSSESSITSSSSSSTSSLMMSPTRETTYIRCCVPTGDCFKMTSSSPDYGLISMENLSDCIRVLCNNENCSVGQYMHRECFESWEQTVLITLKSIGRARSWSDRQRLQNLWTKKGYDLVYKACGCKCGRGHIRKDLDWQPPTPTKASHNGVYLNNRNNGSDEESTKKKKKRNRNQKPSLSLTTINPGNYHPNTQNSSNNHQHPQHHQSSNGGGNGVGVIGNGLINNNSSNNTNNGGSIDLRARTGSLSSSSGTTSPPVSASSESSVSPVHIHQNNNSIMNSNNINANNNLNNGNSNNIVLNNNINNNIGNNVINGIINNNNTNNNNNNIMITNGNLAPGSKLKQLTPMEQQQIVQQQKNKEVELYSERVRSTSGCNGIFSRRLDFSSFNLLPKTRLNSYQVKIEDEGNHGNDETRLFILSSLAQSQMSRVACILCEEPMLVFDRYPLVDGSFFLSPKQHSAGCIEVKYEGRSLFLTCVCMGCLDGTSSGRIISCRFCGELWDGSSLVLGTMYAYDIFAAMPCCAERLKCNTCLKLLLHPQQRLNFFSDYSHCVTCPYCATQDTHFVKPLGYCYTKSVSKFALNLA